MYETILVPTDGSAGADVALAEAVELAGRFDATVHSLFVVDVTAVTPESGYDFSASFRQVGEEATAAAAERVEAAGLEAVPAVETGTPHQAILEYVADEGVDLVVMGTHGRTGIERYLLGSVTEKVVRTADVPVLTVRAPEADAADDGDASDEAAD